MPTRPATAPDAGPSVVGLPSRNCSTSSQPTTAVAAAMVPLTNEVTATVEAPEADPAVNPNQPNHSSPAPTGRLATGPARATAARFGKVWA